MNRLRAVWTRISGSKREPTLSEATLYQLVEALDKYHLDDGYWARLRAYRATLPSPVAPSSPSPRPDSSSWAIPQGIVDDTLRWLARPRGTAVTDPDARSVTRAASTPQSDGTYSDTVANEHASVRRGGA